MTELLIHALWKIHSNYSQYTVLSFGQNAGKATQMLEERGRHFWHLVYGTVGVEWPIAPKLPCDVIENSRLVIARIVTYNINDLVLVSENRLKSQKAGKDTSPREHGIKCTTERSSLVDLVQSSLLYHSCRPTQVPKKLCGSHPSSQPGSHHPPWWTVRLWGGLHLSAQ